MQALIAVGDDGLATDQIVDLADGNVFRLRRGCSGEGVQDPTAPPKWAFVIDDAWEVTLEAATA